MENHSPSISGVTLRDAAGICHGVLPEQYETISPIAWHFQSRRMIRFSGPVPIGLWFKEPPDLFPGQRFPLEQRLFDFFHSGAPLF